MKKIIFILLILAIATPILAGEKGKSKTHLKYPPDNRVLKPGSIWNPWITEQRGKLNSKRFYRYPNSKVLPIGSLWNQLVTVPVKEKGKGNKN